MESKSCWVCYDKFDVGSKSPRVLTCGHSFCSLCLKELLEHYKSFRCPYCKSIINFINADSVPINFSLRNSIEITQLTIQEELRSGVRNILALENYPGTNYFKELVSRTSMVEKAYREMREEVLEKLMKDQDERVIIDERLSEMINELKRNEYENLDNKNVENRIEELVSLISKGNNLWENLEQFITALKDSSHISDFLETSNNIQKLLENEKQIPNEIKELEIMCRNRLIFAVKETPTGPRYGKVQVKDGRVWVSHFQIEEPEEMLIYVDDFSWSSDYSKLPKSAFLQLTLQRDNLTDEVIEIIIETDGISLRANNFVQLCSGLEDVSYKGMSFHRARLCAQILPGPLLEEGTLNETHRENPPKVGGVYGMVNSSCGWFLIPLTCMEPNSVEKIPMFGVVVDGLQKLMGHKGNYTSYSVTDCGLVF